LGGSALTFSTVDCVAIVPIKRLISWPSAYYR
jgi:hypothetical protein